VLTVTRKEGQSIVIGDGIRITVKTIKGRQVRLAIDAPKEVPVYREEIYQEIVSENERAAAAEPNAIDRLD